jgi:hypothetical protein
LASSRGEHVHLNPTRGPAKQVCEPVSVPNLTLYIPMRKGDEKPLSLFLSHAQTQDMYLQKRLIHLEALPLLRGSVQPNHNVGLDITVLLRNFHPAAEKSRARNAATAPFV